MAKPPTMLGRVNQKASGKNNKQPTKAAAESKNNIQYFPFDLFSDIKLIINGANLQKFLY